ncbi:Tripeptidyl-peptidase 2 [Eumeta japonica]|uniref:Tripeptidyl-peptidase 2 n=1 Tax=Eumeta variegata TaxID=151549 RepID=A0A4C1YEL2_EUMVA|nr:Tripeptidyl-peptidase 2 [Eumeta japonica]
MTQVFPFVELKKEREYSKAQHIVFYKELKCIRFTYNEFKVFSFEFILKGFHFVEQRYNENPQFIQKNLWSDERSQSFRCASRKIILPSLETLNFKSIKMADGPIDCEFPVWGLLPKKETGVVSFLSKSPEYDGRNTIIAIFDSGVDPAAAGLSVTSTGETKVIERYDCSGSGDVDTSTVVSKLVDGCITGITGRKLTIPESWRNPSGEWRIGVLYPFGLYPTKLKDRVQEYRSEHHWDVGHKPAYAQASKELQDFESEIASSTTLTTEQKYLKEELEARVESLQAAEKKYNDAGPTYDCVLFHDGTVWRACIDTSECGDLKSGPLLGEYSVTHEHAHLTPLDEMTVSINVHNDGCILEVVGMCYVGTRVEMILLRMVLTWPPLLLDIFLKNPDKNGVAPGAKIVSLSIGDSRLGSMETGTALVRACIKIMELSKKMKIDVINMSYGEHAHWSNAGRVGDIICEVVNRYGVCWVVSAGNHGPALCTVGAPPDIAQPILIGVGAYVSPEMMSAAYSMRTKLTGGAFSWSSRGPAADGAAGVSVCAPGGAVASVARFTLRNSQLMNGTSMAAPHVAGAIGALISGLKAKDLPYSPYSVKRALENSATYLNHVEPWAQGCGLLNVEKAFELLTTYHDQPDRDVTFSIQCGTTNAKGILLRPKLNDIPRDIGISVEPQFLQDHQDLGNTSIIPKQIEFGMRLTLTCNAAWVSIPNYLDMMNTNRPISVQVDTTALPPGPHFTSICAYDVVCIDKGPVLRIPITVLQPEPLQLSSPGCPSITADKVLFKPSTIKRHLIIVPLEATWGVLKIITEDKEKFGRFLIHTMQILPRRSCRSHENQKLVTVNSEAPTLLPFRVMGGITLEVVLAKYWANIGDLVVDYSIEFHGIKPDFGTRMTFHGAEGLHAVNVIPFRMEEVQPSAQIKYNEPVLRPSESKISPLSKRDVIPPSRQIYQLVNTYNFHLAKGTEVSPIVALLCDMLYESEFESQMWMLFNSCKQLMAVGDAYPSKYSVKLEKGDYVLRLNIRHEQRTALERMQELPILLQQKLPQPLTLDVYGSQSQALISGKKFNNLSVASGIMLPLYFAAVPYDKISRSNLTLGQLLTGTVTFAKDELGRKVDYYDVQYVVPEPPKRSTSNSNSSQKDKEKGKSHEDYMEALKDFKTGWLSKLEGDKLEQVYEELVAAFPGHFGVHIAYLHSIDSPTDYKKLPHANQPPGVTTAWCEQQITISETVIKQIDQERLLAYLGMKNDTRTDANKIKQ